MIKSNEQIIKELQQENSILKQQLQEWEDKSQWIREIVQNKPFVVRVDGNYGGKWSSTYRGSYAEYEDLQKEHILDAARVVLAPVQEFTREESIDEAMTKMINVYSRW